MAYTKYYNPALDDDVSTPITAAFSNHLETGIFDAAATADSASSAASAAQATADAAIPKTISGYATDKVPVYNGTNWVAQKIVDAQIDAAAAIAYSKLNLAGGIVDADVSGSAAIAQSKLAFDAWQSYTPTWTSDGSPQPSLGNGTLTGKYVQIGKTVHGRIEFTAGSTTTFGTSFWAFTLPTSVAGAGPASVYMENSGLQAYPGFTRFYASNQVLLYSNGTALVSASVPFAWSTSDFFVLGFSYEST